MLTSKELLLAHASAMLLRINAMLIAAATLIVMPAFSSFGIQTTTDTAQKTKLGKNLSLWNDA